MDAGDRPVLVLLVDDDDAYLEVLKFFLEREGAMECEVASSAREALETLSHKAFDAIVSDYLMPDMDGLELLKIVRLQGKDTPFIMLTGRGREDVAIQALNHGADYYVQKGGDPKTQYADLANMIRRSTRERKAVTRVREGERFLNRLFESVQDGVSIVNKDMVIEKVNPTMERWFSGSMPLVGRKCHEAYSHSPVPCEICPVRETFRSGRMHQERIQRGIDGNGPRWLDVFSFPVANEETGEVERVIEYLRDVTEEEDARQALAASESRYKAVMDLASEGVLAIESGGGITFANPQMAAMLGCGIEEIVGKQIGSLVDRGWLESVGPGRLHKTLESGGRVEVELVRKDGSMVRAVVAVSPVSSERGMFDGAIAVVVEVSELRKAIEGLMILDDRFAKIFKTSPQMMMVARASDSVILDANDSFLKATGYSLEQLVGKSYAELGLVPKELADKVKQELAENGLLVNLEASLTTSKGDELVVRLSCYSLDIGDEECTVFLSCDLTSEGVGVRELRRERDVLKTILESTPDGIIITDPGGKVVECNATIRSMLGGVPREQLLGREVLSLLGEEGRAKASRIVGKLLKEGVIKDISLQVPRQDGIVMTAEVSAAVINDSLGKPLYLVAVARDVTDQTRYQSALEKALEERRQMESIIESSPAVAIRWLEKPGWPVDYVSSNVQALGYDAATLTSGSIDFVSIIHPDDRDRVVEEADRLISEGKREFEQEYRIVSPNGKVFWVYDKTTVLRGADGKVVACQGVIVDITEMKDTLERLSRTEKQMKMFMDTSPVVKFMKDRQGRYVYVNRRHQDLFGESSGDWIGKTDHDLLPPEVADRLVEADRKVMETGAFQSFMESIPQDDGTHEYVTYKFMVPNIMGGDDLLAGVAVDLTERRRYERALRSANEKLNLLSDMTRHDITNQLSVLTGWLTMLREGETDPARLDRFDTIESAAAVIQELLAFASEYKDMGALKPVWTDVRSAALEGAQGLPLEDVSLEVEVSGIEVYVDPMFGRVFRNLVDNSLRHGEKTSCIRVTALERGGELVIVYEDDGVGIPEEARPHIFERGFGKHTGLGLFMVREVLGLTGITIRETGQDGSGARFEIAVPEGRHRGLPGKG